MAHAWQLRTVGCGVALGCGWQVVEVVVNMVVKVVIRRVRLCSSKQCMVNGGALAWPHLHQGFNVCVLLFVRGLCAEGVGHVELDACISAKVGSDVSWLPRKLLDRCIVMPRVLVGDGPSSKTVGGCCIGA